MSAIKSEGGKMVNTTWMGLQSTAGSLQSLCWGASACGGIVSAYWSGALIESLGVRGIFLLTSAFPLLLCGAALLVNEDRTSVPGAPSRLLGTLP